MYRNSLALVAVGGKIAYNAREIDKGARMFSRQDRREIRFVLFSQIFATLLIVLALGFFKDSAHAVSGLYGGLISIIPTCVFASMLFRYKGAQQAKRILRSFYVGEGLKLLLTVFLFAGAMIYLHPIWWAVFLGFMTTHLSLCIAPLFCIKEY